jgi:hypothetical protein
VFGGLEPLHRYNLHFTEGFLRSSRYKAVTSPLQGVTSLRLRWTEAPAGRRRDKCVRKVRGLILA